jgi:DNA-directed RNA polymerase specialized sigma24 family protein
MTYGSVNEGRSGGVFLVWGLARIWFPSRGEEHLLPGWPDVGRTDDHRLLEALRRGDAHAPASLYDAYADRLNDYAHSLLHDQDLAAEAVHDSLVIAYGCVDRLTEPARLRAWLYALARTRSAARTGGRTPPHGAVPPAALDESADPQLAAVVHEALGELGRHERQALELSVRHELSTGEIGAVLGTTSRQAAGHLSKARGHVENSAAAIVLARTGRAHCPDLSALVDSGVGASWRDGPLSVALRKRLSRHISGCKVCVEGRERHVSADPLLTTIPIVFPPLSLRRHVIDTCVAPEREAARAAILEQGDRFDRRGFPIEPAGPSGRRRTHRRRASRNRRSGRTTFILLAAVFVFGTAGAATLIYGQAPESRLEAMNPAPQPPDSLIPVPENDPPETAEPEETTPAPTTPPPTTSPPTPSASPRARVTTHPPPAARPTPTRTTTRTAPGPVLEVGCPGGLGAATGGAITLAARNAAVDWTATAAPGVTIAPKQGRLKAGASGRITVTITDPGSAGSGIIALHSAAGNPTCRVSWSGTGGSPSPEPPADPSPDPSVL